MLHVNHMFSAAYGGQRHYSSTGNADAIVQAAVYAAFVLQCCDSKIYHGVAQ